MAQRPTKIDTLTHDEATRKNAPTAELEAFVDEDMKRPIVAAYQRRNPDLDPQLVWRGKDVADWSDLVVNAPPLYIQEKIHPKAIVEDLKRASARRSEPESAPDLFADFNGIEPEQRTEFYQHDQHWSNRMILGDGLQVMASLAEREGLKGQVQCIYIDPPYGIKFNSNFQWSTTSRDVKDGKADHMSREPEQVKAFRDTWADGIHSYLTYLRDRLTVARDLLTESGSIFVQISDENVHRVRTLLEEVFGENLVADIVVQTTTSSSSMYIDTVADHVLWFAKDLQRLKYRPLYGGKSDLSSSDQLYRHVVLNDGRHFRSASPDAFDPAEEPGIFRISEITSQTQATTTRYTVNFQGASYDCGKRQWSTPPTGMRRLIAAARVLVSGSSIAYMRRLDDYPVVPLRNIWTDTGTGSFTDPKVYVVQTGSKVISRCILMATDPGDLVLDPTCGSGTTAYVAEQWGRRWITIDTSRVALALARARIMGARYPWYLLADSPEGQRKEAEITRAAPKDTPTYGRIRQGFVYRRVPHITLKSIANNAEIDTIWEGYQEKLEPLRASLNAALGQGWEEWQIPREAGADWSEAARSAHAAWWQARIARQKEIDASIAAKADTEYLYDQPYEWKDRDRLSKAQEPGERWRVAGPFTVESLSPHRVPAMDVDDSLFDELEAAEGRRKNGAAGAETADFAAMVLDNLRKSGVQQRDRADRLVFESMKGWPGDFICAEGRVRQASDAEAVTPRRAAILVGPEYGTVARADLTAAAREAAEAGFDILIAAAFNFDAHAGEFEKMGRLTVLKARINPDLHMPDLANTGAGNLFTVFGEPDIQVHEETDGMVSIEVAGSTCTKAGRSRRHRPTISPPGSSTPTTTMKASSSATLIFPGRRATLTSRCARR
jgi:adenine-specific DNA-methyltransferase